MGVGAERPKTWGGSSQKLGRIDRVWGGRGADRPGADRPVPDSIIRAIAYMLSRVKILLHTELNCVKSFYTLTCQFILHTLYFVFQNSNCGLQ